VKRASVGERYGCFKLLKIPITLGNKVLRVMRPTRNIEESDFINKSLEVEMSSLFLRQSWALALLLILASVVLKAQTSHNVVPIEYQYIQDKDKIQSFFYFFEQRIKLHDYKVGGLFFDSLVLVNNDTMSRGTIEGNLQEFFTYGGLSDSLLMVEFISKSPDFNPVYSFIEIAPIRTVGTMHVGDTVTCILTYQVSTTDSIKSTRVQIKKTDELNTLPVTSYKITEAGSELLYGIFQFARNYIIHYVGINGSVPPELKAQDWQMQWDFDKDDPRPCVTKLTSFNYVDGIFNQIPFEVDYDGDRYSFKELTRNITNQYIDRNLIGHLQDFRVYARANTGNAFIIVCDDFFNRILTMDMSTLSITSMPGAKEGINWGPYYTNLGLMSYNRVQSKLYTFDQGTRDIMSYEYAPSELPGYNNENSYSALPANTFPAQFTQTMTLFDGPVGGGTWDDAVWVSVNDGLHPGISIYRNTNLEKRYTGIQTRCGLMEFVTSPVFAITEFYLPSVESNLCSYEKAELFMVADAAKVAVVNADTAIWSPYQVTAVTPHWLYELPEAKGGSRAVERTIDGIFLFSDHDENMIHVFEPFDGRYLYSTRPQQFDDGNGKLSSIRNLKQNWSTTQILLEDMYVSRNWGPKSGISRYVPTGKILESSMSRLSTDYCMLNFKTSSRTRMSVVLIDSLNNEYLYRGPIYTNAGVNNIAIYNPSNYQVGIKYLPASNENYGSYSLAESMIVHAYGEAPKTKQPLINVNMPELTVDVWPTNVHSRYHISIGKWSGGYISISLCDINGRDVYLPETVYVPSDGAILTRHLRRSLPMGLYIVGIASSNDRQMKKLVKY
jgi:hypothetical protein